MKIARVTVQGHTHWATISGNDVYQLHDVYGAKTRGEHLGTLQQVHLRAPAEPKTIVCIGLNYALHAAESGQKIPDEPLMFFKPHTALLDPGADIVWPKGAKTIDSEAELALVISKHAKLINPADWQQYVLGYTCGNDVSARDWQRADGQWSRAKGFDTSCPLGPWLETDLNPNQLRIQGLLDSKPQQDSNTSDLGHNVGKLVEFVSRFFTLGPGDVIMTGTPAHPGAMQDGSVYTVEIEGIGALTNKMHRPAGH